MNFIAWLIIGAGMLTGGIFWLSWLSTLDPGDMIKIFILLPLILFVTGLIGYLTIYLFERSSLYSIHVAILLPWAPILVIVFALLKPDKLFPIVLGTQVPLVFASIGGVIAHKKRVKKKINALLNI